MVLSHQLATFLAVLILPPILIYMLIKSRGAYLKVLMALILGGGIAFFLYYFQAMIGYVDIIVEHLFFSQKTYAYQIAAASFNSFIVNFGFILILCLGGFFFAFKILRATKETGFFHNIIFQFLSSVCSLRNQTFSGCTCPSNGLFII